MLPSGRKIDLALERTDRRIAVEIAITTTIDWEVGNVAKCLDAGFPLVAVIGTTERKLAQLKEAMVASFSGDSRSVRPRWAVRQSRYGASGSQTDDGRREAWPHQSAPF
jgi:hypothetical protein